MSSRPCTVPSSPYVPCSTGNTQSISIIAPSAWMPPAGTTLTARAEGTDLERLALAGDRPPHDALLQVPGAVAGDADRRQAMAAGVEVRRDGRRGPQGYLVLARFAAVEDAHVHPGAPSL